MNKKHEILETLQAINLDEIPNKTCCGVLEAQYQSGFRFPFSRPIAVSYALALAPKGWSVMLAPVLSSGKPDTTNAIYMRLDYCPFCGARLSPEDPEQQ